MLPETQKSITIAKQQIHQVEKTYLLKFDYESSKSIINDMCCNIEDMIDTLEDMIEMKEQLDAFKPF